MGLNACGSGAKSKVTHKADNGWNRGQTNTDNPAEYGYIRNRIVPLGMKRIVI